MNKFDRTKEITDIEEGLQYGLLKHTDNKYYLMGIGKFEFYTAIGLFNDLKQCFFIAKEILSSNISYKKWLYKNIIKIKKQYPQFNAGFYSGERSFDAYNFGYLYYESYSKIEKERHVFTPVDSEGEEHLSNDYFIDIVPFLLNNYDLKKTVNYYATQDGDSKREATLYNLKEELEDYCKYEGLDYKNLDIF